MLLSDSNHGRPLLQCPKSMINDLEHGRENKELQESAGAIDVVFYTESYKPQSALFV